MVWLVLMKTNQVRLDQSLPEQTANRKLTSCQNGEISEETTTHKHTTVHVKAEARAGKHKRKSLHVCANTHWKIYICTHTKTSEHTNTHTHTLRYFLLILSGESWLPFLVARHRTCTHTHRAVNFKLQLLFPTWSSISSDSFIFTSGSKEKKITPQLTSVWSQTCRPHVHFCFVSFHVWRLTPSLLCRLNLNKDENQQPPKWTRTLDSSQ